MNKKFSLVLNTTKKSGNFPSNTLLVSAHTISSSIKLYFCRLAFRIVVKEYAYRIDNISLEVYCVGYLDNDSSLPPTYPMVKKHRSLIEQRNKRYILTFYSTWTQTVRN